MATRRVWVCGQAIDVDPRGAGVHQQPRQAWAVAPVVSTSSTSARWRPLHRGVGCQGEGVEQVLLRALALRSCCAMVSWGRSNSCSSQGMSRSCTEPARQHRGLIEAPLAQALGRPAARVAGSRGADSGHSSNRCCRDRASKFAEQVAKRPFRAVLEAGDQAVDREAVGPGRNHLFKRRRMFQALAARQAGQRARAGRRSGSVRRARAARFRRRCTHNRVAHRRLHRTSNRFVCFLTRCKPGFRIVVDSA